MLEGLQSSDSAVRSLTQSWVKATVSKGNNEDVHRLLQPLVRILLEADTKRKQRSEKLLSKKITLSRRDAERDKKYAKYYFESLGIENPYMPSSRDQYLEIMQDYTQVCDASQILYALSLLQLVVGVDPFTLISTIGNTVIDVSTYATGSMHANHTYDTGKGVAHGAESPDTPTSSSFPSLGSQKSLLEVVLSTCVDLLCSEYHPSLKASPEEESENLKIKICSAGLLSLLLSELLQILARHGTHSDDSPSSCSPAEFKVYSPSFVSALLTLCDIQKVSLLLLGKSVEWWVDLSLGTSCSGSSDGGKSVAQSKVRNLPKLAGAGGGGGGESGSVILMSFCAHLLRVVQCLIVLDTQFSLSLPVQTHPPPSQSTANLVTVVSGVTICGRTLPAVLPGGVTASQPFYASFLLGVLSEPRLFQFHDDLLHMFTSTVSNLLSQQLLDLAPKLIKQLCSNVEETLAEPASLRRRQGIGPMGGRGRGVSAEDLAGTNVHLCIVYMHSILTITSWCLFGECRPSILREESPSLLGGKSSSCFRLHHRSPNPFFDVVRVKQVEGSKENFSPMNKQPSAMTWLLGVFTAHKISSGGGESDGVSGEGGLFPSRVGVASQAGQHLMMLLPAAYNSMTGMWASIHPRWRSGLPGGGGGGGVVRGVESMESSLFRTQSMLFQVRKNNMMQWQLVYRYNSHDDIFFVIFGSRLYNH